MNYSQYAGILRILAPVLVSLANHYLGADTVTLVGTVLATVVAAGGWSAAVNTPSGLAKAVVAADPGAQVAVNRAASPALLQLAHDPTVPGIVPVAVPLPATTRPL